MNPNNVHDPLRDVLPKASHAFVPDARLVLIACLALLLLALFMRLRRTAVRHPDYAARTDMLRLLAVVWGGLVVEWVRSRFDIATAGFWIASAALLPFVIAALLLSTRLFRVYRQSDGQQDRQQDGQQGGRE